MKNLVMVVALVGFGGAGCGEKSPAEKCEDLVSSVCDRVVDCIPGVGTHDDCVRAFDGELSCSSTKSVSMSYDQCLDMVGAQSCPTLFPTDMQSGEIMLDLPDTCSGVLSTQAGRGNLTPTLGTPTRTANSLGSLAARARAGIGAEIE